MNTWTKPTVNTLNVSETYHTIKWMSHGGHCGWFRMYAGGWNFCGDNYKPVDSDIIDGLDS